LESTPEETAWSPKNIRWIKECLQRKFDSGNTEEKDGEHLQDSPYLPSRLLDVMPDGNYDCRLIVTDEDSISPGTQYMALSYCWGSDEDAKRQFKTQSDTISDRNRGFMDESTPLCIRDAFKVARTLGIRYLWVDVLCIIQGDLDDWEKQSEQMADVYRGALAVICAAASESCQEGFLERNKGSACVNFRSWVNPAISGHYNVRWHSTVSRVKSGTIDTIIQDRGDSRWATRGWTFQESSLAVRAIIFGKTKIHYKHNAKLTWTENEEPNFTLTHREFTSESIEDLDETFLSGWLEHLPRFSGRKYSDPRDILPAISGLAKLASHGNPENYLAGIRKPQLHRDLMWIDIGITDKTTVLSQLQSPDPYVAPSWSWASRYRVFMGQPALEDWLHLGEPRDVRKEYSKAEAQVSRTDNNPYGRISQCRLTISAVTVRILHELHLAADGMDTSEYHDEGLSARIQMDWCKNREADDFFFLLLGSLKPWQKNLKSENQYNAGSHTDKGKDRAGTNGKGEGGKLSQNCVSGEDAYKGRIAYGIIILRALEAGEFYRVGVWSAAEKDGKGGLYYFRDYQESTVTLI
jgi:hypothetical protein